MAKVKEYEISPRPPVLANGKTSLETNNILRGFAISPSLKGKQNV